ncbi:MAG: nucleotide exchange factor GrpE [Gaiellaceae bacterium]
MPSSPGSEKGTTAEQSVEPGSERGAEAAGNGREATELDELRERYERLDDRYRRALADLDNYRKRVARDVERRVAESRDALTLEWLEAVDSVERALKGEPENPLFHGLRAVLEQMEAVLERQGIRRIGERGEQFDPERHEAIGVVHSDELPDNSVADVARSGYARADRVLRPAQVVVARHGERAG